MSKSESTNDTKNMAEPTTQGNGNAGQTLAPVSLLDDGRFAAINLIYGTTMFIGTEKACWKYVHERFGTNMAALLVDVRAV